ncbi:MAG: class I SAM-dependent methyltransferase [Planctomycetota bacterium]|nr:class I SAM-dependent methyltransferase [Planctomycetota bacterium]
MPLKDPTQDPRFQIEFDFWDHELSLEGQFPEDMCHRLGLDGQSHLVYPTYLDALIKDHYTPADRLQVLDVGSGPVSMLGFGHTKGDFQLTAADPLGRKYTEALSKYGYSLPYDLVQCFGEELTDCFGGNRFHIVWMHNALDHSQQPDIVVRQLVEVLRTGGYLLIQGWSREGTSQGWNGLHQHDLFVAPEGRLMCEPQGGKAKCITDGLPITVVESSEPTSVPQQWIKLVFRKINASPAGEAVR